METGDLASISRGQRASRPYPETRWERNHSACPGQDQAYGPSKVATCRGPVVTAEGMIQWIRQTQLRSNGATCYLNSVVTAQLWILAMMVDTVHEVWDAWSPLLMHLIRHSCTEAVDLCRVDFLGRLLIEWFLTHNPHGQQDAGEFAGWFRGILLAKQVPATMSQVHGWESRLEDSVEDHGCLFAPVLLRNLPSDVVTLQTLVEAWHNSAPYKTGFTATCPHVCFQLERHPDLDSKNTCALSWTHTEVTLPRFLYDQGTTVVWEPYHVVAGVVHHGSKPTEGHYRALLFHSGTQLITDDFMLPTRTPRHEEFCRDLYLLWLVPKQHRGAPWLHPLQQLASTSFEAIAACLAD